MQKLYYSISEISEIVAEEQHILRYWEKEFPLLNPKKNRAGNRIYSQKDLFIIRTIKKMLRDEKLSLKGAKEHLDKIDLSIAESIAKPPPESETHLGEELFSAQLGGTKSSLSDNMLAISKKDLRKISSDLTEALSLLKNI